LLARFFPFIFSLFLINQCLAQKNYTYYPWQVDTLIVLSGPTQTFHFPTDQRVVEQSIRVFVNRHELEHLVQFRFEQNENLLRFFSPLIPADTLRIFYQILPVLLQRQYTFFQLDTLVATADTTDSIMIVSPLFENPFAGAETNLKRSGSIVRGVNIGSNKDMTLNSGLNLQLSGQLTDDLEIVAALTDASTPIQPEGNTQSLNEIDQVYIKFMSPWVHGVLGDFNLNYTGSQFGSFSRKLQGVSLTGTYKDFELGGSVSSTRGYFNFFSLVGKEGNQGPYQLLGKNGDRDIIVLAGTERVWIDGKQLVRGETNDYVIEYGNGQITFTNRQLITSESRIEIDFEYFPAQQRFTRNVYTGLSRAGFFDNKIKLRVSYFDEGDDPKKVLESEGNLSEEEIEKIRKAGDDPLAAYNDGAVYVGDSLGYYVKRDTVISAASITYFLYVGEKNGDYNVSFSSVGPGKGEYIREGIGIYRWVGLNKGDYLPVQFLPLPSRQQLVDVQVGYQPTDLFSINVEAAVSRLDRNIISPFGDKDNQDQAYKLSAKLNPVKLRLGGADLGDFSFTLDGKSVGKKFEPVDRINQADYVSYWNLLPGDETSLEEQSAEFKSAYLPWQWLTMRAEYGRFRRQNFSSTRYLGAVEWDKENWFRGKLAAEWLDSRQTSAKIDWFKQRADINKDIAFFQPALLWQAEERKINDQGRLNGFSFYDIGGRLRLIKHAVLSGEWQYNLRKDDIFDPARGGVRIHQATSRTNRLRLDMAEWHQLSGYFQFVFREKDYTPAFENIQVDSVKQNYLNFALQDTTWQDRKTNLIEFLIKNYQWERLLDLQWQYRISVGQTALREKVYIDVGEGRGDYLYNEDLGEYVPDPNGNYILFIVPSGRFEPVADLGTSLRLLLDPGRLLKKPASTLQKIISDISTESYFRVEEQSKDENLSNLYFLKFSTFQGSNTVRGSIIFNQDLYYMRRNRDHSFRFRYRYRDDLFNQFLDPNDNESRLGIERGLWANYKIIEKLKAQSEIKNTITFRENKGNRSRDRDINGLIIFQNFSFRPDLKWEFGLESEYGIEQDRANQRDLKLSYLRGLLRSSFALLGKGKLSASFDMQKVEVLNNPLDASIPYEMARGKKEGVSKNWQLRGEYTIAENVVISVFYLGRDDAEFEKIIHSGQAEIRAYF